MSKRIGFLIAADPDDWQDYTEAFEGELKSRHWTIGTGTGTKDVFIDYQPKNSTGAVVGALGDPKVYAAAANYFVTKSPVNVIVTAGERAAEACQQATDQIPVVIASAGDLSKFAGTNVTGFTNGQIDTQILAERIERMLKAFPPKQAVAVVGNATVHPVQMAMNYAVASLQEKKITVYWNSFATASDFRNQATIQGKLKPPPDAATRETADVLLVCSDPLMRTNGTDLVEAAHDLGMKTMHEFAEWHDKHKGDLCYGPDFKKLFKNAAGYVDQILSNSTLAMLPIVKAQKKHCVQTP